MAVFLLHYITLHIYTFHRSISRSRQREYEIGQKDNVGCDAQVCYDRIHTIVTKYMIQNKLKQEDNIGFDVQPCYDRKHTQLSQSYNIQNTSNIIWHWQKLSHCVSTSEMGYLNSCPGRDEKT
jgi:hypothetical protein